MALKTLPIQFLNLGGEMMYIIDQRLRAQAITEDRADKVRNDILSIMLSDRFVKELFHPQPIYSRTALRAVFHKLAHASIMKMNSSSMDKLFDLMMMALKHQVLLSSNPRELLFITLNHLDAMSSYAATEQVRLQVRTAQTYMMQLQNRLTVGDWSDIRRSLLLFVQDLNIRVSIFLRNKIQDHFGKIIIPTNGPVPTGSEVPGTVRYFDSSGDVSIVTLFPSGGNFTSSLPPGSLELRGDRGTSLGFNLYDESKHFEQEQSVMFEEEFNSSEKEIKNTNPPPETNLKGREELNLLAQIIGSVTDTSETKEFKLNLFQDYDNDHSPTTSDESGHTIMIEGTERSTHQEQLGKIMGQLSVDEEKENAKKTEEDELLELLDSV